MARDPNEASATGGGGGTSHEMRSEMRLGDGDLQVMGNGTMRLQQHMAGDENNRIMSGPASDDSNEDRGECRMFLL